MPYRGFNGHLYNWMWSLFDFHQFYKRRSWFISVVVFLSICSSAQSVCWTTQLTECWSAKIFTLVRRNFKQPKSTKRTIIKCLLISEHLIAIFAYRTMPSGKSSSFWQGDQQNFISSGICTFCHASWYSHKCCAPLLGSLSQSPMQSLQLCRAPLLNSAHFHNLIVLTNLDAAQISCSFIVLGTVHINYLKGLIA